MFSNFFLKIFDFIIATFFKSNPEIKKKHLVRKLENEVKNFQPAIYKSGHILPNIAEAFHLLYLHTEKLQKLLTPFLADDNPRQKEKIYESLISSGFTGEKKVIYDSIQYEYRKKRLSETKILSKEIELQRKKFELFVKELQSSTFSAIQKTINNLQCLGDLCNYNFISVIHQFDPNFTTTSGNDQFEPIPITNLETTFLDLYYITANLEITGSTARAILAINEICTEEEASEDLEEEVVLHLKKISTIIHKILSPCTLRKLIQISKGDVTYEPEVASITENPLEIYREKIKQQFEADEERIKTEIQDEKLQKEIVELFGSRKLFPLKGYNGENNTFLQNTISKSFMWITPMEIIKTFFNIYFSTEIESLLNDVVVEGFFNRPEFKSNFSSTFYACSEAPNILSEFELSFGKGGKNDFGLLQSYIKDSTKDPEFSKTAVAIINSINTEARDFIQTQVGYFSILYNNLLLLLEDVRKPTPDEISNIKLLFSSPRNRDKSDFLEKNIGSWKSFLEIMRNYAIIGDIPKYREE